MIIISHLFQFLAVICIVFTRTMIIISYRHGQPNPDSHSIMRVRNRLPMSVFRAEICKYILLSRKIEIDLLFSNIGVFSLDYFLKFFYSFFPFFQIFYSFFQIFVDFCYFSLVIFFYFFAQCGNLVLQLCQSNQHQKQCYPFRLYLKVYIRNKNVILKKLRLI